MKQKLNDIAAPRTRAAGKSFEVSLRQGAEPWPTPAKKLAGTNCDFIG
jgi:hypothetical protein